MKVNKPSAWIERVEEDYQLAVSSLRRKKPLTYGATFHSQQCAEKYLKALLTTKGQEFPRTHDLAALSDLCQKVGIILSVNENMIEKLSAFAVEVRYPGTQPSVEEAKLALHTAKIIRKLARRYLNL